MKKNLSYRDAGVNIDAGYELVSKIKPHVKRTNRPEVIGGLGGFGGLFALDVNKYKQPILVSGTDGVGTKLKLAIEHEQHDGIGIDLVAMCVNDVAVIGAEPLFFLDYYATGELSVAVAEKVIASIATGCEQAGCALVGGETAEMPGMYQAGDYDLAGFCVGVVDKPAMVDGSAIGAGDTLIGIKSSGPHANGFSLIRAILTQSGADWAQPLGDTTLGNALMAPTAIYVKALMALTAEKLIHGAAHITGGGFIENIPRMLPDNCNAHIDLNSWAMPAVMQWLQQTGKLPQQEMLNTFNCGIGMMLACNANQVDAIVAMCAAHGHDAVALGQVVANTDNKPSVIFSGELA